MIHYRHISFAVSFKFAYLIARVTVPRCALVGWLLAEENTETMGLMTGLKPSANVQKTNLDILSLLREREGWSKDNPPDWIPQFLESRSTAWKRTTTTTKIYRRQCMDAALDHKPATLGSRVGRIGWQWRANLMPWIRNETTRCAICDGCVRVWCVSRNVL